MGRYPLGIDIAAGTLSYKEYLEIKDENSIFSDPLMLNKALAEATTHKNIMGVQILTRYIKYWRGNVKSYLLKLLRNSG